MMNFFRNTSVKLCQLSRKIALNHEKLISRSQDDTGANLNNTISLASSSSFKDKSVSSLKIFDITLNGDDIRIFVRKQIVYCARN